MTDDDESKCSPAVLGDYDAAPVAGETAKSRRILAKSYRKYRSLFSCNVFSSTSDLWPWYKKGRQFNCFHWSTAIKALCEVAVGNT